MVAKVISELKFLSSLNRESFKWKMTVLQTGFQIYDPSNGSRVSKFLTSPNVPGLKSDVLLKPNFKAQFLASLWNLSSQQKFTWLLIVNFLQSPKTKFLLCKSLKTSVL